MNPRSTRRRNIQVRRSRRARQLRRPYATFDALPVIKQANLLCYLKEKHLPAIIQYFDSRDVQDANRSVSILFPIILQRSLGPDLTGMPCYGGLDGDIIPPAKHSRQQTRFRRWLLRALAIQLTHLAAAHGRTIYTCLPPYPDTPVIKATTIWCITTAYIPDASINDLISPGQLAAFPDLLKRFLSPPLPGQSLPKGYLFWQAGDPAVGKVVIDPIDPETLAEYRQMVANAQEWAGDVAGAGQGEAGAGQGGGE